MINSKEKGKSALFVLIPMILLTIFLQVIHLPQILSENRPDLLILVIIFFGMNSGFPFKLETSWIAGIILDLVTGAPLGINAFMVCTQVYLIGTQFHNFKKYAIWQQAIIIGVINLVVSVLGFWIEHIIGQSYYEAKFLIPAVATAVFWPIIYVLCTVLCVSLSVKINVNEENIN
ncbi:MAG: rod shape-determining protein MreD [Succinivibrio sp.]